MGTASATRAARCAAWLNAERSWSPVGDGRALPALGCSEAAAPQQWTECTTQPATSESSTDAEQITKQATAIFRSAGSARQLAQ